eukprot:Skav218946  [mRNA]  locus=scaffold678:297628:299306:+ [translate_table: standard]
MHIYTHIQLTSTALMRTAETPAQKGLVLLEVKKGMGDVILAMEVRFLLQGVLVHGAALDHIHPQGVACARNANLEEWQSLQELQPVMNVPQASMKTISSLALTAHWDLLPRVETAHVQSVQQDPLRQERAHQLVNPVLVEPILLWAAAHARNASQENFLQLAEAAKNAHLEPLQKLKGLRPVNFARQGQKNQVANTAGPVGADLFPPVETVHVRNALQDPLRQDRAHQLVNPVLVEPILLWAAAHARNASQENFLQLAEAAKNAHLEPLQKLKGLRPVNFARQEHKNQVAKIADPVRAALFPQVETVHVRNVLQDPLQQKKAVLHANHVQQVLTQGKVFQAVFHVLPAACQIQPVPVAQGAAPEVLQEAHQLVNPVLVEPILLRAAAHARTAFQEHFLRVEAAAKNAHLEPLQKLKGLRPVNFARQGQKNQVANTAGPVGADLFPPVETVHVRNALQDPLRQDRAHQLVNPVLVEPILLLVAAHARTAFQENFL